MKEEMHTLQTKSCQALKLPQGGHASSTRKNSNWSTLSLPLEKCNQSNGVLRGHIPSKEGNVKLSQVFNPEQLLTLSATDVKLGRKGPLDASADGFYASGDLCMSECFPKISDMRCVAYNNRKEQYLLESISEQQLSLSNLSLNGSISLADISGKNNLLNLINYFPQKSPNFCSRKKLLILDINGILADIVYPPPKGYKADTKIAGRAVFTRPFCSDFLSFCLERFNVAIWSSRSRKIIDRLINYLIGDMKHKLIFCWDLSHCTQSNFRTLENKHKALVFKELRKVWETHGYFNESNTLLLDDTPYKALLNPPHTAIFPYSYDFKDRADIALGPRGNIRAYLEELAVADNVQKYIEQHPFGQSAITDRSLSWRFYNKVIQGQSAVPATG